MACMTGAVRRKARVAQVGRIFITAGRSVSVTAVTGGCEVGEARLAGHTRSGPLAGEIPGLKPVIFGVRCHRAEARRFRPTDSCRLSGERMRPHREPFGHRSHKMGEPELFPAESKAPPGENRPDGAPAGPILSHSVRPDPGGGFGFVDAVLVGVVAALDLHVEKALLGVATDLL